MRHSRPADFLFFVLSVLGAVWCFVGIVSAPDHLQAQVVRVHQTPGDLCARINDALLSLPMSSGGNRYGIVDATAINGTVACGSDPFANFVGAARVKFGGAVFVTTAQWIIPDKVIIEGISGGRTEGGVQVALTAVRAASSFPINTPVVRMGRAGGLSDGIKVRFLQVDCNSVTGSIGIFSSSMNELSVIEDVRVLNCTGPSIQVQSISGTEFADMWSMSRLQIQPISGYDSICIDVDNTASGRGGGFTIEKVTCQPLGAGTANSIGVRLNAVTGGRLTQMHFESLQNGIKMADITTTGTVFSITIDGATCTNLVPDNCVWIAAGASAGNILLTGISAGAGTTNLVRNDQGGGVNVAVAGNNELGFYHLGRSSPRSTITNLGIFNWAPTTFANLGAPANGAMRFCSDCTIANPCAGAGTGAFAKRLNGVWVCN